MAYNSNIPQQKYVASAGQTVFPFLFKIFQEADLTVYNVAPGGDPELATPLTLNVDYTVIINGDLGGSITLIVGASDGALVTIYRRLSITRYVEYQTSGDLLADTLNADQDYQTYLVADLADAVVEELSGAGPGTPISDAVKKTGDTMTGTLTVPKVVLNGTDVETELNNKVSSDTTETGTIKIVNMVQVSQSDYDALTPVSTTMYVIVG